nr:ArpU family phage packaging/lysis transcriptional regulator [Streptococcus intermedius]
MRLFNNINRNQTKKAAYKKLSQYRRLQRIAGEPYSPKITTTYSFEPKSFTGLPSQQTETMVLRKVAAELGSSVIYCHHHSKGSQGGKKSMDRASGSGVFARDPDALIDLVELDVTEELLTQRLNQAACEVYKRALQERNNVYYQQNVGLDDLLSAAQMRTHFEKGIPDVIARAPYTDKLEEVRNKIQIATAKIKGAIRLTVKWCFPRIKRSYDGQYKTTKPDTDNLQKLLKDCMTQLGYWQDDAQVASEIAEKFWADRVGIYIKVEELP